MKILRITFSLLVFVQAATAQKTIYSKDDVGVDARYQVVGKVGENFMVLTMDGWKKKLLVYDRNMKKLSNNRQKYMPDDVHRIATIVTGEHLIVTYRYAKKNIIYCDAVKLDAYGKRISGVVRIDSMLSVRQEPFFSERNSTSSSPFLWIDRCENFPSSSLLITGDRFTADQTFGAYKMGESRNTNNNTGGGRGVSDYYSVISSEDKSKILVYKTVVTDQRFFIRAQILNTDLQVLDAFDIPRLFTGGLYEALQIDNEGDIFFLAQVSGSNKDTVEGLQLFSKFFGVNNYARVPVDLQQHTLLTPYFKVDNLNKCVVVNAFYLDSLNTDQPKGMFMFKMTTRLENMKSVFADFPPELSWASFKPVPVKIATEQKPVFSDYFFIYDIFFTKGGSYQLVAGSTGNNFSIDSSNTNLVKPEIIFINIDSSLRIIGSNIFTRKDLLDHPGLINTYSFHVFNQGNSLQLMINAKTMNSISVTSRFNISRDNKVLKYPTLRQRATGYSLLPEHPVQVGLKQIIIPYGNIINKKGFALMDLDD